MHQPDLEHPYTATRAMLGRNLCGNRLIRATCALEVRFMTSLEEVKPGARIKGLDASGIAEVVSVSRFGADALNLVFHVSGKVAAR